MTVDRTGKRLFTIGTAAPGADVFGATTQRHTVSPCAWRFQRSLYNPCRLGINKLGSAGRSRPAASKFYLADEDKSANCGGEPLLARFGADTENRTYKTGRLDCHNTISFRGADRRNEDFQPEYAKVINRFILKFAKQYRDTDGTVLWKKIARVNCGKRD